METVFDSGTDSRAEEMSAFQNLMYQSAQGLEAPLGHPQYDPYIGTTASLHSIAMRNQGMCGLKWSSGGVEIQKIFSTDIQAAINSELDQLLVIGHGCADLGAFVLPNNGVTLDPNGNVVRQIIAPDRILSSLDRNGSSIRPDGFSSIENFENQTRIWISYWQGEWYEQRIYDSKLKEWGAVTGHYRNR